MDEIVKKSKFVGFKSTPALWLKLTDAANQKGTTVSKLINWILLDHFREVTE